MGAPGLAMGRGWVTRVVLPAVVVALLAGMWPLAPVTVVAKAPPTKPPPGQTCQHGLLERRAPTEGSCTTTDLGPQSASLPAGFTESVLWDGQLDNPTTLRFASDGRVFVAEKTGVIRVFDSISDATPTVFSASTTNVHNYWDRGLLGMALDPSLTNPGLPSRPWIYVLYTYDHMLGDDQHQAPRWGDAVPVPARPDHRRLRRERAAVPLHGQWHHDQRARDRAHRGLVPAVPEPLDRHTGVRERWRAVRERR